MTSRDSFSPANRLRRKALGELDSYIYSLGKSEAHQSQRNWIVQASHEYADRIILELLQNAHDAHPRDQTDGEIAIELAADEGSFGTLYIANGGRPFEFENVRAICNVGLSSKLPGEDIGNKGIGFRSVLSVSAWPEIYSAHVPRPGASEFDGFCFSFARPDDYAALLTELNAADHLESALREKSPYSLPIPLTVQNDTVRRFARHGYATVIRLPLNSAAAADAIQSQLQKQILGDKAPVLLFLSRIRSLHVRIRRDCVTTVEHTLRRHVRHEFVPVSDYGITYEIAELGSQGRYLVARRTVPRNALLSNISESVEQRVLPSTWLEWKGDAQVAVAVRLDTDDEHHRLYNFLPMGPAALSGCAAHIDAPFYTRANRESVRLEVPLNAFLMDEVAALAAAVVTDLSRSTCQFAARCAVDLLAWKPSDRTRIERGFAAIGSDVRSAPVIPTRSEKGPVKWATLATSYRWKNKGRSILTAKALGRHADVAIIPADLGDARLERLQKLAKCFFEKGLDPPVAELVEWIEKIAARLESRPFRPRMWEQFYDDLAATIPVADWRVLASKRILITDDGRLRASVGRSAADQLRPTVFFPPTRGVGDGDTLAEVAESLKVPPELSRYFGFMHSALRWHRTDGGQTVRRPALNFLEGHLVRAYAAADILQRINEILRHTSIDDVRSAALQWAYRARVLLRQSRNPRLDQIDFFVPTRGGWRRARDSVFAGNWHTPSARDLERLLDEESSGSKEMGKVAGRALLPPSKWPLGGSSDSWSEFLCDIGVQDGLWPISIDRLSFGGGHLFPRAMASVLGLTGPDADRFLTELGPDFRAPRHPQTRYESEHGFWCIPGQNEFHKFSANTQRLFARLVLRTLGRWPAHTLSAKLRTYHSKDEHYWPTPAAAFLKHAAWLPVGAGKGIDGTEFAPLSQAWHFLDEDASPPTFASALPLDLRRMLHADAAARERMTQLGLGMWDDAESAPRLLAYLGRLVREGAVGEAQSDILRKEYASACGFSKCSKSSSLMSTPPLAPAYQTS